MIKDLFTPGYKFIYKEAYISAFTPIAFYGEVYTSQAVPVLSRTGHVEDVYVASGATLTLTYTSDIKATLCGLYGFEDMVETRSNDGRTITLTWVVPADEPGVSRHFGVRAKTAGGEHEIYTRAHINKVAADVFVGGIGTANTTLKAAANNVALTAGCTLIIKDGTYDSVDDMLHIGFIGLQYPAESYNDSPNFPNGVHTSATVGTELVVDVTKFSCIMAETPLGVIIDAKGTRPFTMHMQGNDVVSTGLINATLDGSAGDQNDGLRQTRGILFMAFASRNGSAGDLSRTIKCGYIDCSILDSRSIEDPLTGQQEFTGDGGTMTCSGSEDNIVEGNHIFGNNRYQVSNYFAHKTARRKTLITCGAMQGLNGEIYNSIAYYNDLKHKNYNCWDLDSAEYILGGVRYPDYPNLATKIDVTKRWLPGELYDENVIVTYGMNTMVKGLNDDIDLYGHAHLNDARPGLVHCRESGKNSGNKDILENSYGWYTRRTEFNIDPHENYPGGNDGPSALHGGNISYKGVTCGRADWAPANTSMITPWFNSGIHTDVQNVALISPSWNYTSNATDIVFYGDGGNTAYVSNVGGVVVVDPPTNISATWTAEATTYNAITKENAHSQGLKYTCRVEPKSPYAADPRPCQDIFRTKGRYLTWWNHRGTVTPSPNFETVYEDVNWYNRLSVSRVRREHQAYACTSNGLSLVGSIGHADGATSRADYYQLTYGVTTDAPVNTPYIINIWGYVDGTTVVLSWDGIPAEYIGASTGLTFYVDDVVVGSGQSLDITEARFPNLAAGSHEFYIVVENPVTGNSGPSKPITLTV